MRFASRMLLVQLACVTAVVVACTAVYLLLATLQLREEAQSTALGIARTVAAQPQVRQEVTALSDGTATATAAQLRAGPMAALATRVTEGTRALFVVITDDRGRRLSHPDAARIGETVSTSFAAALAGRETVSYERGTLGDSARAKVPVFAASDDARPVGEVSVGFDATSVFADLPHLLLGIGAAAGLGLLIGGVAALWARRMLERRTLGLQPEELTGLVQHQAAVLEGVGDGVVAVSPAGVVQVCNATAAALLGLDAPLGRRLQELGLPPRVLAALTGAPSAPLDGLAVRDRVVYLDVREVRRRDVDLGRVAVIRDRTDLVALAERLEAVGALSNALRAQRHEFANRLHVAAGLIDADRVDEARAFLDELLERGPLKAPGRGLERVTDPYLQAFLGAKSVEAAERGVELRVGEDTLLIGTVAQPEDVATVLGNLVDNAIDAAAASSPAWIEVELLDDGELLLVTVVDSGPGVGDPEALFAGRTSPPERDTVHGHGIGLPLCREVARRLGGDVWLADPGGGGAGAMLCARLPGAMGLMEEVW